jgi:hypothetical protein
MQKGDHTSERHGERVERVKANGKRVFCNCLQGLDACTVGPAWCFDATSLTHGTVSGGFRIHAMNVGRGSPPHTGNQDKLAHPARIRWPLWPLMAADGRERPSQPKECLDQFARVRVVSCRIAPSHPL